MCETVEAECVKCEYVGPRSNGLLERKVAGQHRVFQLLVGRWAGAMALKPLRYGLALKRVAICGKHRIHHHLMRDWVHKRARGARFDRHS